MAFSDRLRSLFFAPKPAPLVPDSLPQFARTDTDSLPDNFRIDDGLFPAVTQAESILPAWLTDEDTLRDEGILYGLSLARPDEKLAVIRACFEQTTVGFVQQIEDFNVQIGAYNLLIDQQETRIQTLLTRLDALIEQPPAESQLVRTLVGLGLTVTMSAGNFLLIDALLVPAFPQNRWIAGGVFLAGLAGGAGRPTAGASPARQLLETGGLPLSAAVFMLAESWQFRPVLPALASFAFVLTLFLLAGKWLPGYLTRLQTDWLALTHNRQLRRDRHTKPVEWEREILACEQEISVLRTKKWQLQPALSRAETGLRQQHAHRDRLLKLFESEFCLARSQRDHLAETDRLAVLRGK